MKTFLFSLPDRLKSFNDKLDIKGILCGKSWEVFNDEGIKQVFIFNPDGTLLISNDGKVIQSTWQYIPANSSIIITADNDTTMFKPAFYDDVILALKQDNVEQYLFMVDESQQSVFAQKTLQALLNYFDEIERDEIEYQKTKDPMFTEEQRAIERADVLQYVLNNREALIRQRTLRLIPFIVFAALLFACAFIMLFKASIDKRSDLFILFTFLSVSCLSIGFITNAKTGCVLYNYNKDTHKTIKYLSDANVKQLIKGIF